MSQQEMGEVCRSLVLLGRDAIERGMGELADAYADAAMRIGFDRLHVIDSAEP